MTLSQTIATFVLLALFSSTAVVAVYYLSEPPPRQRPQRPMSPIEMYVAGGGDMSTANDRVQALLMSAEESWQRSNRPTPEERLAQAEARHEARLRRRAEQTKDNNQ